MNLLVITDKSYPYGSAYSSRVRHFVMAFHDMGYKITMISANLDVEDATRLGIDGVEYISMNYPQNRISQLGIGVAHRYLKELDKVMVENKYDAIFVNSITYALPQICEKAKKHAIPVFVEKCEWYDKSSFIFGKFNPYYREYIREIDSVQPDGYVVISPFFERYYEERGFKTFLIPTILDVENIKFISHKMSNITCVAFSGSLGNGKEKIGPLAEALDKMGEDRKNFVFEFYGPSEQQIKDDIGNDALYQRIHGSFHINGRIPQKDVYEKIAKADFTFFFREKRRSSDAGFPTKLAESFAVGTPVITNETGSINKYLFNHKNGLLIQELSVNNIIDALHYIRSIDDDEYQEMRVAARTVAEQSFDYRSYVNGLKDFFMEGRNGK